jgi:hypothetical protein
MRKERQDKREKRRKNREQIIEKNEQRKEG